MNPFQDSIGNWKFLNLPKFPNFSKRWRHYDTFDWIKDYRSRRDRKDSRSLGKRVAFLAFQFFVEGGGGGEVSGGRDERAALVALEFCIIEGAGSLAFKRNVSKMETF